MNKKLTVRYVIFDFDGTLFDSKEVFLQVFNQLAEKHHFKKILPENIDQLRKLNIIERCRQLNMPLIKIPFISKELLNLYGKSIENVPITKGIEKVINELHEMGYVIAIISSNSRKNVDLLLKKYDIQNIEPIHCSSNIFGKGRVIKRFMKLHHLKKDEVIYVGDEQRDVEACKENGIKIIWVSWGYDVQEALTGPPPDFIIHKPDELPDILANQDN